MCLDTMRFPLALRDNLAILEGAVIIAYGLPFVLFDGITGANIPASVAGPIVLQQYVSGTGQVPQSVLGPAGLQPPVIVTAPTTTSASVTVTANNNLATFDNTGGQPSCYLQPSSACCRNDIYVH
jgi:hypothetical protein